MEELTADDSTKTYNFIKGEGNKVFISPSLGIAFTVYMETISRN